LNVPHIRNASLENRYNICNCNPLKWEFAQANNLMVLFLWSSQVFGSVKPLKFTDDNAQIHETSDYTLLK